MLIERNKKAHDDVPFLWAQFLLKKADQLQNFQHLSLRSDACFRPFYIQMSCVKLQKIAKL